MEGALYFLRCDKGKQELVTPGVAPQPWYPLMAFALCCCVAASGMPDLKKEIVMDGSLTLLAHQHGEDQAPGGATLPAASLAGGGCQMFGFMFSASQLAHATQVQKAELGLYPGRGYGSECP